MQNYIYECCTIFSCPRGKKIGTTIEQTPHMGNLAKPQNNFIIKLFALGFRPILNRVLSYIPHNKQEPKVL